MNPVEAAHARDGAKTKRITTADPPRNPEPHRRRLRPILMGLLRILIFPWGLWHVSALIPRRVFRDASSTVAVRPLIILMQGAIYLIVGLPLTIFLLGEVLVSVNEWLIAEQADYRLQSDFAAGTDAQLVSVPGPEAYSPEVVPASSTDAYRRYLTELFAPVIVHKISSHPEWDVPRFLDFDGNADPRDNLDNEPSHRDQEAGVYGEMTAETEDSYYLTYSLYHVKDYDHPVRERLVRWTYHDNDNEGLHIRVDKATMQVAEVETWFHNRFLLYNRSGRSAGTEPVHGAIHLEGKTHVLVYAQPQGHGVRLLQAVDLPGVETNVKIMRYRGDRAPIVLRVDRSNQSNVTYQLRNFDAWYALATGPFLDRDSTSTEGIFEGTIRLGTYPDGRPIEIGRYIAGQDYYVGGWARPKPMWSWDDGWDAIPILTWHFFPSYSFESHGGEALSHDYLFNRPVERVFGEDPETLLSWINLGVEQREGTKWAPLEARGGSMEHAYYWAMAIRWSSSTLKRYVNYLFHALG